MFFAAYLFTVPGKPVLAARRQRSFTLRIPSARYRPEVNTQTKPVLAVRRPRVLRLANLEREISRSDVSRRTYTTAAVNEPGIGQDSQQIKHAAKNV
ncbi:hypothetical protein PUN28_011128 [Cardiocondyla obscurior]|uniref:Uncharacterized protein n=1 Tax=Cardiocondyla obscurior TaxID=286306 RepID=A0AAW2FMX9_9HYME